MNVMNNFCGEPGTGGISMDTRFAGIRMAEKHTGNISGINTVNLTPENLTRSCMEGLVEELAEAAANADFSVITDLVATGNAVRKIPQLIPAIEKRFRLSCRIADSPEEATLGAINLVLRTQQITQ